MFYRYGDQISVAWTRANTNEKLKLRGRTAGVWVCLFFLFLDDATSPNLPCFFFIVLGFAFGCKIQAHTALHRNELGGKLAGNCHLFLRPRSELNPVLDIASWSCELYFRGIPLHWVGQNKKMRQSECNFLLYLNTSCHSRWLMGLLLGLFVRFNSTLFYFTLRASEKSFWAASYKTERCISITLH
jgi:hypothetical protein